jgi:hypothetical protein
MYVSPAGMYILLCPEALCGRGFLSLGLVLSFFPADRVKKNGAQGGM